MHIGLHRFVGRYSDKWPAREASPGPGEILGLPASEPGPQNAERPAARIVVRQVKLG